ncbi:muts domain V-domain-containing protein [Blakeslea trispora]|nr:muts domain V-domain-containing protein [Blakeslea trispora]
MEVIMCLKWSSNKLGCAYYCSQSLELYLMEDIHESDQFYHVSILIAQCSPTLILLSESNMDSLQNLIQSHHGGSIKTQIVPNKDLTFEKGRMMLLNWFIRHIQLDKSDNNSDQVSLVHHNVYLRDPEEGSKTHAYLQLEGLIQLENSHFSIGCAGIILKYLQDIQVQRHSETASNQNAETVHHLSVQPISVQVFSCQDYVHITSDTLKALCIFDLEADLSSTQKEAISLFGLLDKTKSVLGKQLLRQWVAHPLQNQKILSDRHQTIRFFTQKVAREQLAELSSYLKHIKNIHRLLSKIKQSRATCADWQYILKFAYFSIKIIHSMQHIDQSNTSQLSLIQCFKELNNTSMQGVGAQINDIIDFESSKEEARVVVKGGIDADLDTMRERYNNLDDYLLQVSQEISTMLPDSLGEALNVVYFPQLGYLITLPKYHFHHYSSNVTGKSVEDDSSVDTEQHQRYLAGFQLQFTTSDNLYYKNDRTKELDQHLGDIHSMITDKEIEILQALSEKVLEHTNDFIYISKVLSELDCILSLTLVALKFNYTEPIMTTNTTLKITKGRHPLQELCMNVFIPNDTHLEGGRGFSEKRGGKLFDFYHSNQAQSLSLQQDSILSDRVNSVQIVTGANFSGKSVYLKQIALIVYMAHIGSFVPAESAMIGIVDKLFTRIQTSETVAKPQSAFGYDLQQLNRALYNATSHSLVIIDEFGRGTDCSDGAALFCAVIGYFLSRETKCPKIVASTHFHDLITKDLLSMTDGITLSQTKVLSQPIKDGSDGDVGDEVVFLYEIIPGNGYCSSYGTWCATIAGLPSHTIQRAIEFSNTLVKGKAVDRLDHESKAIFKQLEILQKQFLETDINELDPIELIQTIQKLMGA